MHTVAQENIVHNGRRRIDCARALVLIGALVSACDGDRSAGDRNGGDVREFRTSPPPPFVLQDVEVGTRLSEVRVTRPQRTATDLAARVEGLAAVMMGQPVEGGQAVLDWAGEAVTEEYEASSGTPLGATLHVYYLPHTDTLHISRLDILPPVDPPKSSLETAEATADSLMIELVEARLRNDASFGVVSSGSIVVSGEGEVSKIGAYLFTYAEFFEGVAVVDSAVDLVISADSYVPLAMEVRQPLVSTDQLGAPSPSEKSSSDARGEIMAAVRAEYAPWAPNQPELSFSEARPMYWLPLGTSTAVLRPRLVTRWIPRYANGISGRSQFWSVGFRTGDVPGRTFSLAKPLRCLKQDLAAFVIRPYTRGVAVMDTAAFEFFSANQTFFMACNDVQLYTVGRGHVLAGVEQGSFLALLGFQDGDENISFCGAGDCFAIDGHAGLAAAFEALAETERFAVKLTRNGIPTEFTIELR